MRLLNQDEDVFIISDEDWEKAKQKLTSRFRSSTKLDICLTMINDFETINPKRKFKSDLAVFIRESKLEDFINTTGETIFVSTIHKAKGKEFDNVFLMLENFDVSTDAAKRQVYVAMTRAKQSLTIHLNSGFMDNLLAECLERVEDTLVYLPPNELVMQLTHKDVKLGYFSYKQYLISQLVSGDELILNGEECQNQKKQPVLKFSNKCIRQLDEMKEKGFELKKAKVNFCLLAE